MHKPCCDTCAKPCCAAPTCDSCCEKEGFFKKLFHKKDCCDTCAKPYDALRQALLRPPADLLR